MTDTLISLISNRIGITGANLTGYIFKPHSIDIIGNKISGVLSSVFLIKSFGRLGFDPSSIIQMGSRHYTLFGVNLVVSLLDGSIVVILSYWLKVIMNNTSAD